MFACRDLTLTLYLTLAGGAAGVIGVERVGIIGADFIGFIGGGKCGPDGPGDFTCGAMGAERAAEMRLSVPRFEGTGGGVGLLEETAEV